jgi:hypothetical protein
MKIMQEEDEQGLRAQGLRPTPILLLYKRKRPSYKEVLGLQKENKMTHLPL